MKKILVAEDDPDQRNLLISLLKKKNYEVAGAIDGQEALELIASDFIPDLLITDGEMPRINGPKLIKDLVAKGYNFPIITVSGLFNKNDWPKYQGAMIHISKPYGRNLIDEVNKLLED